MQYDQSQTPGTESNYIYKITGQVLIKKILATKQCRHHLTKQQTLTAFSAAVDSSYPISLEAENRTLNSTHLLETEIVPK